MLSLSNLCAAARALVLALLFAAANSSAQEPAPLTTARELRSLVRADAEKKIPVRITAVVTLVEPGRTVFCQDETGGTFMRWRPIIPKLAEGDRIVITGQSYPGLYVPGIDPEKVELLGRGELPRPVSVTFADLASGQFNYEQVELRGIVRAVGRISGRTALSLAMGDGRIELHSEADAGNVEPLIDAAVRVRGLAAGFINDKRQLVSPHLRMRSFEEIRVEQPPPADPFAEPLTRVDSLLQFSPTGRPGHRVRVRGVVTHHEPGRSLFLRDGSLGLAVQTRDTTPAAPGDLVEVLGFPAMGSFSAKLEDAVFRVVQHDSEPVAFSTDAKTILKGAADADLVSLDGTLLEVIRSAAELTLVLQAQETPFHARIAAASADSRLASLRPASQLRLTGVCTIAETDTQPRGFRSNPRSFELLLRSPRDVVVLAEPPWWTAQRLALAAEIFLALLLAALAWATLLRRQVAKQTAVIGRKIETEATIEERQRIAREFHDTLEQELVGLALRLDALAANVAPGKPRELLDATRRLVQRLQEEARSFVWNLRDSATPDVSLAVAIETATASVRSGGVKVSVETKGQPRAMSALTEHNLTRVAQEAATNAVKHGSASTITIGLDYSAPHFTLTIRDDGHGFDPAEASTLAGHFGLTGMRERVSKMGGALEVSSTPGNGATIRVQLTEASLSH